MHVNRVSQANTLENEEKFFCRTFDCLFDIFAANLHNCRLFLHLQPEDAPCRGDRGAPDMVQKASTPLKEHYHHQYTVVVVVIIIISQNIEWLGDWVILSTQTAYTWSHDVNHELKKGNAEGE